MKETRSLVQCRSLDPNEDAMRLGRDEWKAEIVSSYPTIFQPPRGLPECRAGWEQLIDETCSKIEDALKPEEGDTLTISRIIERCGRLHIFWEGILSARARAEVEKAIERASIESGDTCEICGGEGRLYSSGGWLLTACTGHGRGKPLSWKRRVGFVRIVRGTIDGKDLILSCREYEPEHDLFVDIPPETIAE
ncbi:hypothetical protein [Bradyrhizobium sp. BR 1432]|uniref:hypothetical protein n=1 Tax=Bradyrhizobium sp. BR 1432 TaxID=3447966 RepID=UPI003EE4E7F7